MKKIILFFTFLTLQTLLTLQTSFAQVTQEWVQRYNGGMTNCSACSIGMDTSGNIYVTGTCISGEGSNFVTIKYNANGIQQWVQILHHITGGNDLANSMRVDTVGNVYVTGESSVNGFSNFDYQTVKYNTDGVQQWVSRYDGPAHSTDEAFSISVDKNGCVYVTGRSTFNDSWGSYDITTIKYNQTGDQQWVQRYGMHSQYGPLSQGGKSITVDDSCNVYITGMYCNPSPYYTTIKYNTYGTQQWTAIPSTFYGQGNKIVLDENRNVFVTGYSGGQNYTTIKYNNNGVQQWVSNYAPGSYYNEAYDLGVDHNGNVSVTGVSPVSSTNDDYVTVKYNNVGDQQWLQRYNGPGNSYDEVYALTLDDSGNIYITGQSIGINTNRDCATIKYNTIGTQQWIMRYNGPENLDDGGIDLVIDKFNNVYVAGSSNGNYLTIKYSQFSGIRKISTNIPDITILYPNFPNPFNYSTLIKFNVNKFSNNKLLIYDILGRCLSKLVDDNLNPGEYEVNWNANNVASGIYFVRMITENKLIGINKLILCK